MSLGQHWHPISIWTISLASIAMVLLRPWALSEAIWAAGGALLLVAGGLIAPRDAARAVAKGTDVYLFLAGMMVISELARREGVFDWVAARAVRASAGSSARLFALIYGAGMVVTVLLSNDATAVVLTPAVLAAVRAAGAEPLPYLMACAFIANAASFVLPISNPANLVVYGGGMPPLVQWVKTFSLPSIASILITYFALLWAARRDLREPVLSRVETQALSPSGVLTLLGIGFMAVVLTVASALNFNLGAPACAAGLLVALILFLRDRSTAKELARNVSWSVLPLVAGLFVIVEALDGAGALRAAVQGLEEMKHWPHAAAAFGSGFGVGMISNLLNNLPSGLIAASAVRVAHTTGPMRDAILIGVDLGPNLSVTGSLATILWLIAMRREGLHVGFFTFLKWGALVMPPALFAALAFLL